MPPLTNVDPLQSVLQSVSAGKRFSEQDRFPSKPGSVAADLCETTFNVLARSCVGHSPPYIRTIPMLCMIICAASSTRTAQKSRPILSLITASKIRAQACCQ
jgi:hypothetical protein